VLVGGDKRDAITRTYRIEAGEQIRLVCGNSVLELNAGGQVNLSCENFNITANQSGQINTLAGALDLNIGGQAGTTPKDQGIGQAIGAEVEAYFSDDQTPPVGPALDGENPLPSIASPFLHMDAPSSVDGDPVFPETGNGPSPPAITTGLGEDVDALVALSPSLQADLEVLRKKGWEIEYGPEGGGSFASRTSTPPRIVIADRYKENGILATRVLAHEAGHALYPYEEKLLSLDDYVNGASVDKAANEYVNGALADEGAATLYNIRIQREILEASNPKIDIGISGPKDEEELALYNSIYDAMIADEITSEQARHDIGQTYRDKKTSTTKKTYDETFRKHFVEKYIPWLERERRRQNIEFIQNGNN